MKELRWEYKETYLIPMSIYYGNNYFVIKGPKEELEKLKQMFEEYKIEQDNEI